MTEPAAKLAVSAINGAVLVTERVGSSRSEYVWSAEITPALMWLHIDGKEPKYLDAEDDLFDAEELVGYGKTRREALGELVTHLSRVTFAILHETEWDTENDRPRFSYSDVAWDGEKLAPIPEATP